MFYEFYPKAEKSSLAYYLKECKLDNKLNMPFHYMFKYYGRALKKPMLQQPSRYAK